MLAELCGGRDHHHDLVLPSIGADLSHLDEPAARVLLHVQVETLRFLKSIKSKTHFKTCF